MEKIAISRINKKRASNGAEYLLLETNKGKMAIFDSDLFAKAESSIGKEIEAEILTKDNYKNVVELGDILGEVKIEKLEDTRKNVDAGNIVQRAVELTIAIVQNTKEPIAAEQIFRQSLELVTEAFIETKEKL